MAVAQELEKILIEELGLSEKIQFAPDIEWPYDRSIPDVNAAFFLQSQPIAYFSYFETLDPQKIRDLHQIVWSQSKAPLLFVTSPHEIRIYNGYEPPAKDDEDFDSEKRLLQNLTRLTDYLAAREEIRSNLVEANNYESIYLETGAFWNTSDGQKINYQSRADQQLVKGIQKMREELSKDSKLSLSVIYRLIGRSIFIRYLEDRNILTSKWVQEMTNGQASDYRETLQSHQLTYSLYEQLSERFNGDLFPVEPEEKNSVANSHLKILLRFLNREDLETGQLSLWPFRFEYIPVELVSNIYDIFLDDQKSSGAYYTPLLLADFVLEETMGYDVVHSEMKILDPACGSGVFLVGAYRRLVQAWRRDHGQPTPSDLIEILKNNIFGVDKEAEAVRIAAFSLYLELLNHLTADQVLNLSFRFPELEQKNLIVNDFFDDDVEKQLAVKKFDRVVGNMPWGKGSLTHKGKKWLDKQNYSVGGKQAAPAFLLRIPAFCHENGEMAVIAPAKSSIHVKSNLHLEFQKIFFSTYKVRAVVNFAALVYELFHISKSPAVALFYTPDCPPNNHGFVYGVPKPSVILQHLRAIVLDTTEIQHLALDEILVFPELWKIFLWGSGRDAALIKRLKVMPTLAAKIKQLGWELHEGLIANENNKESVPIPDFLKVLPSLPTEDFVPFYIANVSNYKPRTEKRILRSRSEKIYQAPLVLIRQSQCKAALVEQNLSFTNSFSVINGNPEKISILKWIVCFINSPLAFYYIYLTSTRLAVERDTPVQKEYVDMPFVMPDESDPRFQEVVYRFDQVVSILKQDTPDAAVDPEREAEWQRHEDAINRLVYELCNIHPVEQQLIEDTLKYGLEFFRWVKKIDRKPGAVKPVKKPDEVMLRLYADVFTQVATSFLKVKQKTLNAKIYRNGAPLTVVSFDLVDLEGRQPVDIVQTSDEMRAKLRKLDQLALTQQTPSIYMRRHVRIYDGQEVSLIRPSEQRFWTQSQARIDADAFLAELLL